MNDIPIPPAKNKNAPKTRIAAGGVIIDQAPGDRGLVAARAWEESEFLRNQNEERRRRRLRKEGGPLLTETEELKIKKLKTFLESTPPKGADKTARVKWRRTSEKLLALYEGMLKAEIKKNGPEWS